MNFQREKTSKHPLHDEDIIALYWARDEKAIEETDFKYRSYLFSVVYHVLYDRLDCEECLNDTYLDTWNTIPPSRPRVLGAYLVTIARRRALDAYRRRTRQKRGGFMSSLPLAEDISAAPDESDARRIGELISGYLRTQSDHRRRMFLAYYYLHRSTAEIARSMGVSRSAVQKQLASVKRELRTILEKEDITL